MGACGPFRVQRRSPRAGVHEEVEQELRWSGGAEPTVTGDFDGTTTDGALAAPSLNG